MIRHVAPDEVAVDQVSIHVRPTKDRPCIPILFVLRPIFSISKERSTHSRVDSVGAYEHIADSRFSIRELELDSFLGSFVSF